MKKGMCRGCEHLKKVIQIQHWKKDGVTRIEPPLKAMMPFCREYKLHIEYVEAINKDKDVCPRYFVDA